MRIFTCTPVAFGGGADFFARDSGLLCRGFQQLGIESRAVMPGKQTPEDEPDLIRTVYQNLESPEWWESLHLDGVVLYAWGSPKFRKVAAAIHAAGAFLILNQDNGGLISPLAGLWNWLHEQWVLAGQGRGTIAWLRFFKLALWGVSAGVILTDFLRASHLRNGNVITCVSPEAADHYRKLCRIYGGEKLAARVVAIPHPVELRFRFNDATKRRQVVCVGRWWDILQKRPHLLTAVIGSLVTEDAMVSVVIAGETPPDLEAWHSALPETGRIRVKLLGNTSRDVLSKAMDVSRVFYSPSAFESFGIAAAEALCSGCSVVAENSISMASFRWFVSEKSGTLAEHDDAKSHVSALRRELDQWDAGHRDPARISQIWGDRLHANRVAARVVKLVEAAKESSSLYDRPV